MDLTEHIASKSDQMDYQDFLAGPRTVTIREVRKGPSAEQPVEILADGLDRPWRPAKSMRRVLVAAWGPDSTTYLGRRITLFGDPTVKWAGAAVGGIRVSAMSHLDKPLDVHLTVARGKRQKVTVQPLVEQVQPEWQEMIAEAAGKGADYLRNLYSHAVEAEAPQDVLDAIIQAGKAANEGN